MTMPLGIKSNDPSCTAKRKPFEEFSPVRKKVGAEVTPLNVFVFLSSGFLYVSKSYEL